MSKLVRNLRTYNGPGVYCGRPGPHGNPFVIGKHGTREEVIAKHKTWFLSRSECWRQDVVKELRGKILICYCKPLPCHCDFLAEYVNEEK